MEPDPEPVGVLKPDLLGAPYVLSHHSSGKIYMAGSSELITVQHHHTASDGSDLMRKQILLIKAGV